MLIVILEERFTFSILHQALVEYCRLFRWSRGKGFELNLKWIAKSMTSPFHSFSSL